MSRHYSLKPRKFQIELRSSQTSSVHGGQLALIGILRQAGFMDWIAEYPELDHRKNSQRGFDPEVYVIATIVSGCSGGTSLSDVEDLGSDGALLKLLGLKKIPDQSALGEWLRALDESGRDALKKLNRRLCTWILHHAQDHFTRHSISYNKWTTPLDRAAAELPENTWGPATLEHWRGGQKHLVSYNWIRHQPEGCTSARLYAVLRHKREDDMFWQYCYIEVEAGRGTTPAQSKAAFERHRLKGECERRFSEILSDMGLHRPPCHSLGANDAWYTLGAIAYNLLGAMKLLVLPEKDLAKRPRTIMQRLLLLPMELKAHARQLKAVISICAERLKVWEAIFAEWLPDHRLNRRSG